jgi:acyl-CoA thioesterase FadM
MNGEWPGMVIIWPGLRLVGYRSSGDLIFCRGKWWTSVINLQCDFKSPVGSGDRIVIRTTVAKPEVAALTFKFEILLKENRTLLAQGETTQVLLTTNKKMIYRLSGEFEKRIRNLVDYCS